METACKPLSISWSSLQNWEACHHRSYLLTQGKRSKVKNIRVFFPGTVVDRASRDWLNLDDPQPGYMASHVSAVMDREEATAIETGDGVVRWKNSADRDWVRKFCIELVNRLEPILQKYVLPYDYQPAFRFRRPVFVPDLSGKMIKIFLNGEMDYLVRMPGERWAVYDLKATRDESYWRKTLGQITFYSLAVHNQFGEFPVAGGLFQPMCKQQVIATKVEAREYTELMARVIAMAQGTWRKDFTLREDMSQCWGCAVKHACSRGRTEHPHRMSLGGDVTEDLFA